MEVYPLLLNGTCGLIWLSRDANGIILGYKWMYPRVIKHGVLENGIDQ